jgi:two-component system OmpR family response regulator
MRAALSLGGIDLILMDVLLPDGNGIEPCRELRAHSEIPIIILTAQNDLVTRILGLELGADDCVTKPPDCRELIARIRSLTRRTAGLMVTRSKQAPDASESNANLPALRARSREKSCASGWHVNWRSRSLATPQGISIPLSNAEFQLLAAFAQSPGAALSRDQLIEMTHPERGGITRRSIDLTVSRLRAKLRSSANAHQFIRTIRGFGYQLVPVGILEFVSGE